MIPFDIQIFNAGKLVDMFVLDATALGGSIVRFHSGVNELGDDIVWQGVTYTRFPIEASGFELKSSGTLPRPTMKIANITGLISALIRDYDGLAGAQLTRKRTLVKYLDAVNFAAGNPSADPTVAFADEVWLVDRKAAETAVFVSFELAAAFDVTGVKLPRRQFIQNVCPWIYRSAECGYAGGAVATKNDVATTDLTQDACGKRLASCKLRFGQNAQLPFGGFPGAGLIR